MRDQTGSILGRISSRVMVRVLVAVIVALIMGILASAGIVHAEPLTEVKQPQAVRQQLVADGVPSDVLLECGLNTSGQGQVGGWGFRDFISAGSFAPSGGDLDTTPIRPLAVRLGEPCFDDGLLTVPARYTEAPVPILDADTDGEDDGAPDLITMCNEFAIAGSAPTSAEVDALTAVCTSVVAYCQTGGNCGHASGVGDTYALSTTPVDSNSIGFAVDGPGTGANPGTQGFSVNLWCKSSTGVIGTAADQTTTYSSVGGIADTSGTLNCTGGGSSTRVVWQVVIVVREPPSGIRFVGALYSTEGLASGGELGERYYGGTQGAKIAIPGLTPAGQPAAYVRCSEDYAGADYTDYPVDGVAGAGVGPVGNEPPVVVGGVATAWSVVQNNLVRAYPYITPEDCPYLQYIGMWVTTYQGDDESETGPVFVEWSSDRYRGHYSYNDGPTELDFLCVLYPDSAGCYELLNPTYIDGTDFDTVCAGAPEPAWLDFSWLPDFVGHFARCLFVPANGFDRNGEVSSAWEASAGGDLTAFATGFLPAFVVTGTCGELMPGAQIRGVPIEIDTCSWAPFAPLKTLLYWTILIFGSLYWIAFSANTIIGLLNKKTTAPINMDHAS